MLGIASELALGASFSLSVRLASIRVDSAYRREANDYRTEGVGFITRTRELSQSQPLRSDANL